MHRTYVPLASCAFYLFVAACGDGSAPPAPSGGASGAQSGAAAGSSSAAAGSSSAAGGSSSAAGGSSNAGGSGLVAGSAGVPADSGAPGAGGMAGAAAGASGGGAAGATAGGGASAGTGAGGALGTCQQPPSQPATVYMIGDSTMSIYGSDLFPRMGWGQPLGESFAPACAVVVDKALSGRSSKSFFDEGAWTPVKNALKPGDYVLIQFGHNDEKSEDAARYTDPQTTYKQYLTTYVNDTKDKQGKPILLTSINRNTWSGTTVTNSHGAYPAAVRELATALSVPLIDLTALTKSYFERIGQAETAKLFLILTAGQFPNYPDGVTDNTHLQEKGARLIGQLALSDAYTQQLPLASLLKAAPTPP